MEETIYAGITVVILIVWFFLQGKAMTPHDIYKKWKSDMAYISPENFQVRLGKTVEAIKQVEKIFDKHGPNTDAGNEAVEVLQQLRKAETKIRQS